MIGKKFRRADGTMFVSTFDGHWTHVISDALPHEEDEIKWYDVSSEGELYIGRDSGHTYVFVGDDSHDAAQAEEDYRSEHPTIPSPPGSTEMRGGKEYMVTPACAYIYGCINPSVPGSTRCEQHPVKYAKENVK